MSERFTRRDFVRDTAGTTASLALALGATGADATAAELPVGGFASRWGEGHDRVWLGPEYWANPLQDWRLVGGRVECINAAAGRSVHLLTRALGEGPGDLSVAVRVGRVGGKALGDGRGSFGFRLGARGPLGDYRNSLLYGEGLDAGATADGGLFIGDLASARRGTMDLDVEAVELRLTARPEGDRVRVTLSAHD